MTAIDEPICENPEFLPRHDVTEDMVKQTASGTTKDQIKGLLNVLNGTRKEAEKK
jgi:hypothetical protein